MSIALVRPYTSCPLGGTLVLGEYGDSITSGPQPYGGYRSTLASMIANFRGGSIGPGGAVNSIGGKDNALYGYNPALVGTSYSGYDGTSAQYWVENNLMAGLANPALGIHFGLMMLGANDVGDNPATAVDYIGPLIDQFLTLNPFSVMFCASRTPRSFSSGVLYAAAVKNQVDIRRAQGKNVVYVDQYRSVSLALSTDGLHYGAQGSLQIAECWFAQIAPYLR